MQSNSLSILFTNADTLTKDKLLDLKTRIAQNEPQILAFSEVKPKNYKRELQLVEFNIPGYEAVPTNIDSGTGRGMLVYVQHNQKYNLADKPGNEKQISVEIKTNESEVVFVSLVYRSPTSTSIPPSTVLSCLTMFPFLADDTCF